MVVAPTITTLDVAVDLGAVSGATVRVEVLQSRPGLLSDISVGLANASKVRSLMVFFTGNPGLSAFYYDFIKCLATSNSELDVLVVGYAGHGICELNSPLQQFNLRHQLSVANQVVQRFVIDNPCKYLSYYTGGHSIGSYVALKMVTLYPTSFERAFLLTPTICDMAKSPNGKMNGPLVRSDALSVMAASVISFAGSILPESVTQCVIGMSQPGATPTCKKVISQLSRQNALKNVLYLARTEFDIVDELDSIGMKAVAEKLVVVFSKSDKWVPQSTMDNICNALGVTTINNVQPDGPFPQCVLVPDSNYPHAWCINHSKVTATDYVLPYIRVSPQL